MVVAGVVVAVLLVVGVGVVAADPVASCTLSDTEVHPGESVVLDASDSENATSYRFDYTGNGDFGPWGDSAIVEHTYSSTGTYEPVVQVRSAADFTDTAACGTVHVVENEPPTVDLSYSPTTPDPGETVTFTADVADSDGSVQEIMWFIESDAVASGTQFEHAFSSSGEYQVRVEVTDDDGATTTASTTVTVAEDNSPPDVSFTYEPSDPAVDEPVTFTADAQDADGEVVEIEWFIDGEYITSGSSFEYTFQDAGDHLVEVVVTDNDGAQAQQEQTVTVGDQNTAPSVNVSVSPSTPTTGEAVTFEASASDDGTITHYEWQIDGEVVGEGPTVTYTFEDAGEYLVSVTVTDDQGASTTRERTVTVETAPTTTTTTTATTTTTTTTTDGDGRLMTQWWYSPRVPNVGEPVSLVASGPNRSSLTYRWDIDGDGTYEHQGITITHSFPSDGQHTIRLQVTAANGSTDTHVKTITVLPAADRDDLETKPSVVWVVPLDPRPGEVVTYVAVPPTSMGEVAAFRWDLDGDGTVDERGRSVTFTYPENASATVTLWVEDTSGEVLQASTSVATAGQPVEQRATSDGPSVWSVPFNPDRNETVTLVADSGNRSAVTEFRWDLDNDGEYEERGTTVTHAYHRNGLATVRLQIEWTNGSTDTVEHTIPVGNASLQTDAPTEEPIADPPLIAGVVLALVVIAAVAAWRYLNHD